MKVDFGIEEIDGQEVLVRYTPLPQYGVDMFQREGIITKEAFIECCNKWLGIEFKDDQDYFLNLNVDVIPC